MEVRRTILVSNSSGLHARPCHSIVTTALEFDSDLRVSLGGRSVNGKSILELMSLNASCGSELEVCAVGEDAGVLVERLEALFDRHFNEAGPE